MRKGKAMNAEAATADGAKRGRKPGTKVQSLDWRAAKTLAKIDFDHFYDRKIEGDKDWRDDLIEAIIFEMRDKDIF